MAKFLLAVWPYPGHLYPNLAVAHALQARGHEVAFYTGSLPQLVVEAEGFTRFPYGHLARGLWTLVGGGGNGDDPSLYQRLAQHYTSAFDQRPLARLRQLKAMYLEMILGTVPDQVADLEAVLARWQPDVLVSDPFMWAPFLVLRETCEVPVAIFSFFAACLLPGPDVPLPGLGLPYPDNWHTRLIARVAGVGMDISARGVRHAADAIRRRYGLQPLAVPIIEFAAQAPLYLAASTPEFDYQRDHLPASVHYVGPCLWDKPLHEPAPAWLARLPQDRPLAYVTEGTASVRAPILLQAAAEGLADLPIQVVMTTGRHRDPAGLGLGPVSPNVRIERWVSHSDLFPKVSLVVTHGGSGTVLAALSVGVPLVIVPMQWDHAENAQRVARAGAGLCLAAHRCTPERLRAAVKRVLDEPSFRENAQRLAASFARYGGPGRAAELLERSPLASSPAGVI
jgi:MGT family glycosyltransferase